MEAAKMPLQVVQSTAQEVIQEITKAADSKVRLMLNFSFDLSFPLWLY